MAEETRQPERVERVEKGDEFVCRVCHGQFTAAIGHDDAVAEMDIIHGEHLPVDDRVLLCHECWKWYVGEYEKLRREQGPGLPPP